MPSIVALHFDYYLKIITEENPTTRLPTSSIIFWFFEIPDIITML